MFDMPELPEVETVKNDLNRVLPGKIVGEIVVKKSKMIRGSASVFVRNLKDREIRRVERRAKLLIMRFKGLNMVLITHLKMTGQLIYCEDEKLAVGRSTGRPLVVAGGHGYPLVKNVPNKFTHVVISFKDGSRLYFNDMRQFGYMAVVGGDEEDKILSAFGVEPLGKEFNLEYLRKVLEGRRVALKMALMNQQMIAGVGSIYADEACFTAGVRPTRRAGKVTVAETEKLRRAIVGVLRRAIKKRGTTFGSYRDGLGREGNFVKYLKVYGREGKRCGKCKRGMIKRVKVGGRSAHFCPVCQK